MKVKKISKLMDAEDTTKKKKYEQFTCSKFDPNLIIPPLEAFNYDVVE